MIEARFDDAKSTVVQSLQARLSTATADGPVERAPGSHSSSYLELAIDYALSPRRQQRQAAFLESDVLRNAKFARGRSARLEADAMVEVAAFSAPSHQKFNGWLRCNLRVPQQSTERPGVHTRGPGGRIAGTATAEFTTPEHIAVVRDLEERLRASVATESHPLTSSVLDGMLGEETVSESATRLGVSCRTIDRLRARIRDHERNVLSVQPTTVAHHILTLPNP